MWRRGADPDGYVANFVETEQIMQLNRFTASFVLVKFTYNITTTCIKRHCRKFSFLTLW